jgi:hypothetical protein
MAIAAHQAAAGAYSGTTSERQPVSFKIVGRGTAITNFATTLSYNGKCGQGGGPNYNAKAARIAIGAGGKFSKKITLKLTAAVHAPGRIFGTASASKVSGTVVQFFKGKANKCYTETFTARRA